MRAGANCTCDGARIPSPVESRPASGAREGFTVRIERDQQLASTASLATVEVRGAAPQSRVPDLEQEIELAVADLFGRFHGLAAGQIPHLRPARELYRAIGLDPTRHRPSPEALLRRVLRGDPFPRIHPAVDLGNVWAILHGRPVGLYDLAHVESPVTLRLGRAGESYVGIRKDDVHLEGRLTLADARGPFGNPSSDSLRTAVSDQSRDLLYVLFAPAGDDRQELGRWLDWLVERAPRLLGGTAESAMVD